VKRLAAALALVAALLPLSASAERKAELRIADPSPLVVRGSGFRPLEHITVSAFGRRQPLLVRRVVATRRGAFTVRFAASLDWCYGIQEIRAVGRGGSTADVSAKPALGECAEP